MKKIIAFLLCFFYFSTFISSQNSSPLSPPESIECTDEFLISKFRDNLKKGKIVIGRPIEYNAKPTDGTDWEWAIGYEAAGTFTPIWQLTPTTPSTLSFKGEGKIPNADLPEFNTALGGTYSTIRVKKKVGSSPLEARSTDAASNIPEGVKVFFEKDVLNPFSNEPNWYHYWHQLIPSSMLMMPGIKLYDEDLCAFTPNPVPFTINIFYNPTETYNDDPTAINTYGSSSFKVPSSLDQLDLAIDEECDGQESFGTVCTDYRLSDLRIDIYNSCGYQKQHPAYPMDPTQAVRGIHCFLLTVVHELKHFSIKCELWADGYSSTNDVDIDGYPDDWELENEDAKKYGFKVPNHDDDIYEKDYDPNHLEKENKGTWYEEVTCRAAEAAYTKTSLDSKDWSFDPTGTNQGKQWNP